MKNLPIHQTRIALMFLVLGVIVATGWTQKLVLKNPVSVVAATANGNVKGFAWSDNIGWISFNSSSDNTDVTAPSNAYGVNIDTTGNFSGYAWSDNIGWISFNADAGIPPATPLYMARVDWTTGKVTGWARALSGVGRTDGWDGWIKLSDDTNPSWVGKGAVIALSGADAGKISGWAWGAEVVGWIDMNTGVVVELPTTTSSSCPNGATNQPSCNICPAGQSLNVLNICTGGTAVTTCLDGTPIPPGGCSTTSSTTCLDGTPIPPGGCSTTSSTTCPDGSLKSAHVDGLCSNGTPGDGGCDLSETIFNSPNDCKPQWFQF